MGLLQPFHLIVILIVVLIFGPGKLPDVGSLGKSIREFRQAVKDESETSGTQAISAARQQAPEQREEKPA